MGQTQMVRRWYSGESELEYRYIMQIRQLLGTNIVHLDVAHSVRSSRVNVVVIVQNELVFLVGHLIYMHPKFQITDAPR